MRIIATLVMLIALVGCTSKQNINIIQKPISFDDEREALSVQYLKERHGIIQNDAKIDPKMVVVHWTVVPTLDKTFDVFNPTQLASFRKGISGASALNVSAHFLVDRDGTIYQLMPTDTFARHVIGLNYTAIGIENIADGNALPLTKEQIDANIQLIQYLAAKHDIDYVIGHHEYQQFIGHELWKETDPNYLTHKTDVGDGNMRQIRNGLAGLKLKPIPNPEK
ncbi:peptidoglycan recognition protein family protein [Glaciecola sp. 1036]|uniref:peptidoglycan recognition protein family protein n=1 Tax=Alteromonadaceae TaxID=72275 RepID=UPI003D018B52